MRWCFPDVCLSVCLSVCLQVYVQLLMGKQRLIFNKIQFGVIHTKSDKLITLRNQPQLRGHRYILNKPQCNSQTRQVLFAIFNQNIIKVNYIDAKRYATNTHIDISTHTHSMRVARRGAVIIPGGRRGRVIIPGGGECAAIRRHTNNTKIKTFYTNKFRLYFSGENGVTSTDRLVVV